MTKMLDKIQCHKKCIKSTWWTNQRAQQFRRPVRSGSQYSLWAKYICQKSKASGSLLQQIGVWESRLQYTDLHREKQHRLGQCETMNCPTAYNSIGCRASRVSEWRHRDVILWRQINHDVIFWRQRNHDVIQPMTSEGWWRFTPSSYHLSAQNFIITNSYLGWQSVLLFLRYFSAFIPTVKPIES